MCVDLASGQDDKTDGGNFWRSDRKSTTRRGEKKQKQERAKLGIQSTVEVV